MKETGLAHWNSPNTGATNESGFSGLPGGLRADNGVFALIGLEGDWGSSTEDGSRAWVRRLFASGGTVGRTKISKKEGLSVRCLRD